MEFGKFLRIPFLREQAASIVLSGLNVINAKLKKTSFNLDVSATMKN